MPQFRLNDLDIFLENVPWGIVVSWVADNPGKDENTYHACMHVNAHAVNIVRRYPPQELMLSLPVPFRICGVISAYPDSIEVSYKGVVHVVEIANNNRPIVMFRPSSRPNKPQL